MLEPLDDPLETVDRELTREISKWIQEQERRRILSELPYDVTNPPLSMDDTPSEE